MRPTTAGVLPGRAPRSTRSLRPFWALLLPSLLLAALIALSLFVGSGHFSPHEVVGALLGRPDVPPSTLVIIRDYRVARTVAALLVGSALGVAGVLMQSTARNPLADPGLLGVNAGAYLAIVLGALTMGISLGPSHVLLALVGAALATVVVHGIGSRGPLGGTPAKLVLTGVALTAVLTGVGSAISLLNPSIFDKVRSWNSGSLQNTTWEGVTAVAPFILVGLALAAFLPGALNTLLLGEDSARALGTHVPATRGLSAVATTLLCGAATAAAGPVSFVGLLVPHALRTVVGPDVRWLLPGAVLSGPILVLAADVVGRVLIPGELPMGVVTAFLGAPVLVALVRTRRPRSAKVNG